MKPILEVIGISKRFLIDHQQLPYLSFREKLTGLLSPEQAKEEFWALRDVSFDVHAGESIGIIGRNGAGKSTLLKILSRITPPTSGKIAVRGRVASLLEVGTGFHQELTGRENIFMNGSILGMRTAEIKTRFDEIVDFSGVERFLDTPLKHYSSGMQLRLAFSVAAHLDPEILIIDEVLAVGDAEFQKKCLGKMEDITGQGRTILFVSHNMAAIKGLCKEAILLERGGLVLRDATNHVVERYFLQQKNTTGSWDFKKPDHEIPGFVNRLLLTNGEGKQLASVPLHEFFVLKIQFTITEEVKHFIIGVGMTTAEDFPIRTVWSTPQDIAPGVYEAVFEEKTVFLTLGKYKLIIGLSSREQPFQYLPEAAILEVEGSHTKEKVVSHSVGVIVNAMDIKIVRK